LFYRRTDGGRWIACNSLTEVGAKREAAIVYRFGREDAVWQVAKGDDKAIIAERRGHNGKWFKT
jgi:hypothetical protein